MPDVFIAYAREDRGRVAPVVHALQAEGWSVSAELGRSDRADADLGAAGAILVVWSPSSRSVEMIRSEAGAGLYKNKLIQVRLDAAVPPSPFDQVEVIDLSDWSGARDAQPFRRIVDQVRLFAGAPGAERPQVILTKAAGAKAAAKGLASARRKRSRGVGRAAVSALALAAAAGVFFVDPLHWRGTGDAAAVVAASPATATVTTASTAALAPASLQNIPADPIQLVALLRDHPSGPDADAARAALKVADAQLWATAVSRDTAPSYQAYLDVFPGGAGATGAATAEARQRLVAISKEREEAIREIQIGLKSLSVYSGEPTGRIDQATEDAARAFFAQHNVERTDLTSAAPRDLRALADFVRSAAQARAQSPKLAAAEASQSSLTAGVKAMSMTAAGPASARTPAPPPPMRAVDAAPRSAALSTARENSAPLPRTPTAGVKVAAPAAPTISEAAAADRARMQSAQQGLDAARGADALAATELARVESTVWDEARAADQAAGYHRYLANFPAGGHAADAKAALRRLNPPRPFALDDLSPEVRAAVDAARAAQASARSKAAAARTVALEADAVAQKLKGGDSLNARSLRSADGATYLVQVARGLPNGLGVKLDGAAASQGDVYRGEFRNGVDAGLGVYEYGDNPNNHAAGALRYEGETRGGGAGLGVVYWRNGSAFAGDKSAVGDARGVMIFADGQRYEGEMHDGQRDGLGAVFSREGKLLYAGRWRDEQLVEPLKLPD